MLHLVSSLVVQVLPLLNLWAGFHRLWNRGLNNLSRFSCTVIEPLFHSAESVGFVKLATIYPQSRVDVFVP